MGSEPGERMNTRGVALDMSSYSVESFTGGLSTNCGPRFSLTKSTTANITCGSQALGSKMGIALMLRGLVYIFDLNRATNYRIVYKLYPLVQTIKYHLQ